MKLQTRRNRKWDRILSQATNLELPISFWEKVEAILREKTNVNSEDLHKLENLVFIAGQDHD